MPALARRGVRPRVLLVGAGHAHVEVLRQAAARPQPDVDLVLALDRNPAIYSGMLPGFVAGQYRAEELAIDAVALAQRAGAEVVLERICGIDAPRQRVLTQSGREVGYDFASLDVGSGVLGSDLPGVDAIAVPVRPIERLIAGVEPLIAQARRLAPARGPSGGDGVPSARGRRRRRRRRAGLLLRGPAARRDGPSGRGHAARARRGHSSGRRGFARAPGDSRRPPARHRAEARQRGRGARARDRSPGWRSRARNRRRRLVPGTRGARVPARVRLAGRRTRLRARASDASGRGIATVCLPSATARASPE